MVQTYEAVYHNGAIRLPDDVHLPDHTRVYVVVPEATREAKRPMISPHLVHPQQVTDFVMEVVEAGSDASL